MSEYWVYGTLAYDVHPAEPCEEEYSASPVFRAEPEKASTRQSPRRKTAGQSVSPLAVLGMSAAAFLFAVSILMQARLMSLSTEATALQNELSEQQELQKKLRISHESAFSPEKIEQYATEVLHMQRPTANQIFCIAPSDTQTAAASCPAEGQSVSRQFPEKVSEFLAYLRSYLQ